MSEDVSTRLYVCKECGHVTGPGIEVCPDCREVVIEPHERDDSPYCDCGAIPDDNELDFNRCSCCGKRIE